MSTGGTDLGDRRGLAAANLKINRTRDGKWQNFIPP